MSLSPFSHEHYKQLAQDSNPALRAQVGADPAAPPELLYYLSTDKDEQVRCVVAGNEATPWQAASSQAADESRMVRAALARKVGRALRLAGADGPTHKQLLATLEKLCRDTETEVRQAVAVTLQDTAFLPPAMARLLAEDSERLVAGPVLRFCLSLTDEDLVGLVKRAHHEWVPVEVASRPRLSNTVANAVWESGNIKAAAVLLGQQTETLPAIIEEATEAASVEIILQKPLVAHPQLNATQMERLATFVDAELLTTLAERATLSRGENSDVSKVIRRRLDWAEWRKKSGQGVEAEKSRARTLYGNGQLDDAAMSDAVASGEKAFIVTALALLAKTEEALVEKVLEHQSAKGITALCWKAGISMRTCRQVQIRTARLPIGKALNAREGFHYPLPEADMTWQLEFYGIL